MPVNTDVQKNNDDLKKKRGLDLDFKFNPFLFFFNTNIFIDIPLNNAILNIRLERKLAERDIVYSNINSSG